MANPISPQEFLKIKRESVPDCVYGAINDLISNRNFVRNRVSVKLTDVEERVSVHFASSTDMNKAIAQALHEYKQLGWKVTKSVFDHDDPEPIQIHFSLGV